MISVFDTMALALACLRPMSVSTAAAAPGTLTLAAPCMAAHTDIVRVDSTDALPWRLTIATSPSITPSLASPSLALTLTGTPDDSVRRRSKSVVHSDAYYTRLAIHRKLGYVMLPLFALSYFTGDQLMKFGPDAPSWAIRLHGPTATGVAILFGANALTGTWNLWEGRHDSDGRTRKILHTALFIVASGGFTYAGSVLADEAETSASKRSLHRTINLVSMGISTTSWLIMLIPHQ